MREFYSVFLLVLVVIGCGGGKKSGSAEASQPENAGGSAIESSADPSRRDKSLASTEPRSAKELLEKAQTYVDQRKYFEAIKNLRSIVGTYSDDPVAAEAQYLLGDTYMAYAKDFSQAVDEYRKVTSSYPESRFAVNAQFMIGYVYANYMSNYELAEQEYRRFLELYSDRADSGLIQSVHFELENLGKNINEIPKLKHIAKQSPS